MTKEQKAAKKEAILKQAVLFFANHYFRNSNTSIARSSSADFIWGDKVGEHKSYPYRGAYKTYPKIHRLPAVCINGNQIVITSTNNKLIYFPLFSAMKIANTHKMGADEIGFFIQRKSDKEKFHLTAKMLVEHSPAFWITELDRAVKQRKEIENKNAFELTFKQLFNREKEKTFVLLEDARKAGNCFQGIQQFAERCKLSVYSMIPAPLLARLAQNEEEKQRVNNTIFAAFQRETTISI